MSRKFIYQSIFFFFLCGSLFCWHSAGGQQYADSLQKLLRQPLKDSTRAGILFLLSEYWCDTDSAKGMDYLREALKYNPHDDYHTGLAHYHTGNALMEYDIPRAQQEYLTADRMLRRIETPDVYAVLARVWHNYGALEERKGNEKVFADLLLNKVIPMAIKASDTAHLADYYMSLGVVFVNIFEYDKSTAYYEKAIAVIKQRNIADEKLLNCYSQIADNYIDKENYAKAKPFLDSAEKLLTFYPGSIYAPSFYLAQGRYFIGLHDPSAALKIFDRGVRIADSLKRFYNATSIMMEQYQTYKSLKDYPEAKEILLKIYRRPYVAEMPENMRMVLYELAQTDFALNNSKAAYQWLLKFTQLTDSLNEQQTNIKISELEAKYNYAEKEKEIISLNEKSKRQKLTVWGLSVLFVLLFLLFIYFYKQRKVKAAGQLQSVQQQQQIAVSRALLQGEERERVRLARDLHDGLGGMLAGLKLNLSAIMQEGDQKLEDAVKKLDSSVDELRRISRNLMPESLMRSGLETALKELCRSASTSQTNVELEIIGIRNDLNSQVQIIIYRIVQELLANVLRHAGASEVFLQCSRLENIFYITMEDNGKGFDPESTDFKKGLGLENIRNRVEFLHGKTDIKSSPEKGTVINIELLCESN